MSIFKPKACHLFISPLILNYGGTKLGRVWGTGQKSCVIFFCWCEIHIFGIAVISVLPLFGRDFWIFASMVLTRPFLLGASDCIWKKKKGEMCLGPVLVVLSVFGSVFGPETNAINWGHVDDGEPSNADTRDLEHQSRRWLGHHFGPRETRSACVNCKSWRTFFGKGDTEKRINACLIQVYFCLLHYLDRSCRAL